jgi:hypothetical protein
VNAVVVTRDLMDGSRFRALGPEVAVVRSVDDPSVADADLIVLDLGAGIDPAVVVALGPPVVAYGAHVDQTALTAAVEAGCVDAVPRSRIVRRVGTLLAGPHGVDD